MIPTEVGCCGFQGHPIISFLTKIGITDRSLKVASNRLHITAQYASILDIYKRAQSARLFIHNWRENSWIDTFPKGISTK